MTVRPLTVAAWLAYVGSVLLANVLVTHFGAVDLAPGDAVIMAPAAVFAVGLALVARDVLHETAGDAWRAYVLSGIAAGAALSALVAAPRLVVASAAAFAVSELIDLAVYLATRPRAGWTAAAATSSAVGLVADSLIFLTVAPQIIPSVDNFDLLNGQLLGKALAVTVTVTLLGVGRAMRQPAAA